MYFGLFSESPIAEKTSAFPTGSEELAMVERAK
jgi:hypothetical protein